jgi:hypothetical protein
MAKAEIEPGNCGYHTTIEATADGAQRVVIHVESECKAIQRMAEQLTEVNPYENLSFRRGMPPILQLGTEYCSHAACPVPVGIVKAVEVAAGTALPGDVTIHITRD